MNDNIAIKVDGVNKSFKLPHEKVSSIKSAVVNFYKRKRTFEKQEVLKDVSFEIKKGEFFGIVGRNGSGKSTLLKLLSGIYTPDAGKITINGKITPFIELGVGFSPELTGRENVFLNGSLLGFSRKDMGKMYNDIVEFAELERFMDQKLKNYSSGMQVRLAFSVAIRAKTPILLLDEVLAVGDADFQKKCYNYFMSLKNKKQTVILVTHDMGAVRQYCDRAIMIEKGEIIKRGKSEEVAQEYQKLFIGANESVDTVSESWGEGGVEILKTEATVKEKNIFITTKYKAAVNIKPPIYGFVLYNSAGTNIIEANTMKDNIKTSSLVAGEVAELVWEIPNILSDGKYSISVACCDTTKTHFYIWVNNATGFEINKLIKTAGLVNPKVRASISRI